MCGAKLINNFFKTCFKRKNNYICRIQYFNMPINELGQTINDKGNILCQKIGTKKTVHLSPHLVKNTELMKKQGWEVVTQPEKPPRLGNGSFSAGSYDEEKNQREAMATNDEKGAYNAKMKEGEEAEKKENPDLEFNEPVFAKMENESESIRTGNPGTNKPPPKKRGRKPGTKIVKKVTQTKKEKINA